MPTATSLTLVLEAIRPLWRQRMEDQTVAATELVVEILQSIGPITRRDAEMRAGDRVINHDVDVLPRLSRATGLGLCVYLGNRRIAAASGADLGAGREIGEYADAELVETVLRHQKMFRGDILHDGRRQIVACRPLWGPTGPDKTPVGMVEAYRDLHAFETAVDTHLRETLGIAGQDDLAAQSDRMEKVIRFIDDVSRRLQLLALNGNIIAAQAGDHGRAFRVVCRELGSLAEQSKEAVMQVRALVDELLPSPDATEVHDEVWPTVTVANVDADLDVDVDVTSPRPDRP